MQHGYGIFLTGGNATRRHYLNTQTFLFGRFVADLCLSSTNEEKNIYTFLDFDFNLNRKLLISDVRLEERYVVDSEGNKTTCLIPKNIDKAEKITSIDGVTYNVLGLVKKTK